MGRRSITGITVIGQQQVFAYVAEFGKRFKFRKFANLFRFCSPTHTDIGVLSIKIPVSHSNFIEVPVEVVDGNALLVLGLMVLMYAKAVHDLAKDWL